MLPLEFRSEWSSSTNRWDCLSTPRSPLAMRVSIIQFLLVSSLRLCSTNLMLDPQHFRVDCVALCCVDKKDKHFGLARRAEMEKEAADSPAWRRIQPHLFDLTSSWIQQYCFKAHGYFSLRLSLKYTPTNSLAFECAATNKLYLGQTSLPDYPEHRTPGESVACRFLGLLVCFLATAKFC